MSHAERTSDSGRAALARSSVRALPAAPSLQHLRKQAKDLTAAARSGDEVALTHLRAHLPRLAADAALAGSPRLSEAQFARAREYGFASWPRIKAHVERLSSGPPAAVEDAPDPLGLPDAPGLR